MAENKREKFVRIAENRTQKILDMIKLLGNCSNPYVYDYTQKDVSKIFNAIENALKETKSKFNESIEKEKESRFRL